MSSSIAVQLARLRGTQMGDPVGDAPEKAVTTRPAATALLSVDSLDRNQTDVNQSSGQFIINKPNSIFNGYFNRIAMNEIVLDWCIPNISTGHGNSTFGVMLDPGPGSYSVSLPAGFYTAAAVLDAIVVGLNAVAGAGTFRLEDGFGNAWVTGTSVGPVCLATTGGGNFTINNTELANQLSVANAGVGNSFPVGCPKLQPIYYLDFVSPQLTYNQDLKDNTTALEVRDVLYRWVLSYDNVPTPLDKYNYPIFQGYSAFVTRRYLNYPKQILWNPAMPVGQLSFQVYTNDGEILDPANYDGEMEYQLSLLFSEN